ncbi:hypothetical protein E2C01_069505 [Portunus trituberculatus]|uniref:Uncharacterized protein n=1 Tax=Portunus trituberculatus TaxID=210409 RepID=A0A5B7HQ82_PORTR|nr:hypothetical protein [Portunus trituberculatus]
MRDASQRACHDQDHSSRQYRAAAAAFWLSRWSDAAVCWEGKCRRREKAALHCCGRKLSARKKYQFCCCSPAPVLPAYPPCYLSWCSCLSPSLPRALISMANVPIEWLSSLA